MGFLSEYYLWIKAGHILSVISWMAGLLYLPRLFVYHVDSTPGGGQSETFKTMEQRLLKAIMSPAMIATWVLGFCLMATPGIIDFSNDYWFHAKLGAVILMSAYHGYLSKCVKIFADDLNEKSTRFYRILNEVPTVLMIIIVILVVVRPF